MTVFKFDYLDKYVSMTTHGLEVSFRKKILDLISIVSQLKMMSQHEIDKQV